MILSNKDIREAISTGHVVLDPLVPDNIRKSSIDVRLGQWFWRCDEAAGVYNPRDKANRDRYFAVADGPKLAKPYESVWKKIGRMYYDWPEPNLGSHQTFAGIENDWPVIVMKPRETILAHTVEFVGIQPPGTSEMRARSTWGRNGLGVCKCAGAGDPGYINRWTFELTNFNNVPLIIPIGERIAQMILHVTGDVEDGQYGAETGNYKSNYQSGATLEELKANWTPYDMLPKPSKDKLVLPPDYDSTPFTTNKP
jgi:dCTP deaminase